LRVEQNVAGTGVLVDLKDRRPGLPAVGGLVDAALSVGSPQMPEGGDVADVGVARVDGQRRNVVGVAEADVFEGRAPVG
jgi:hypothetical protein